MSLNGVTLTIRSVESSQHQFSIVGYISIPYFNNSTVLCFTLIVSASTPRYNRVPPCVFFRIYMCKICKKAQHLDKSLVNEFEIQIYFEKFEDPHIKVDTNILVISKPSSVSKLLNICGFLSNLITYIKICIEKVHMREAS